MTTPAWSAAENGLPGNLDATNESAQINQFLGTHNIDAVYDGAAVLTSVALVGPSSPGLTWLALGTTTDLDQPFVMSGTTIGRITVPVLPSGNGASMRAVLCPDNGGNPNLAAPIASTIVSAAYINQVAAVAGVPSGPALATSWSNITFPSSGITTTTWASAAASGTTIGNDTAYAIDSSGGHAIFCGGTVTTATNNSTTTVFSVSVIDSTTLSTPIPQTALPSGLSNAGAAICNGTLLVIGGDSLVANVYTGSALVYAASWDSNTGVLGSWSLQPSLPTAVSQPTCVTSGDTVYAIGGQTHFGGTQVSTVYSNTVTNGQVGTTWQVLNPYPIAITRPYVGVVGNILIVAGGTNTAGNSVNTVYYAQINADGSLGGWNLGPSLPTAASNLDSGFNTLVTDDTMICFGGFVDTPGGSTVTSAGQSIGVSQTGGLSTNWNKFTWYGAVEYGLMTPSGAGSWDIYQIEASIGYYDASAVVPMPQISIPLYATGLSNGATYHVVLQQAATSSASDFLSWGVFDLGLPSNGQTAPRNGSVWTALNAKSMGLTVFDASASSNDLVRHIVGDSNSAGVVQKWSTLSYNSMRLLTGYLESTLLPGTALNSNPTFTSGVSPWTAVNGTITQSNAQTHGGFPFSGLLTPTGGFSQAYAQSELFFAKQSPWDSAQWFYVTGFFYTPTTWANFSLSVNWFDSSQTYISTSSATVSLTGATWTAVSNYFQPPATATYAAIAPTMAGTPTSSNTLFISNTYMILSPETISAVTSAAQIDYPDTGTPWPPTGVTQLN